MIVETTFQGRPVQVMYMTTGFKPVDDELLATLVKVTFLDEQGGALFLVPRSSGIDGHIERSAQEKRFKYHGENPGERDEQGRFAPLGGGGAAAEKPASATKPSKSESEAIWGYTVSSYNTNRELRGISEVDLGEDWRKHHEAQVKEIDNFLDRQSLAKEETVYRGVGNDPYAQEEFTQILDSLSEGDVMEDKGYLSTTRNEEQTEYFMDRADPRVMNITLPKGSKAAYLPDVGARKDQQEMLIARNSNLRFNGMTSKSVDTPWLGRKDVKVYNFTLMQ